MSDHRSTRQAGAATLSNITTLDNIEIFTPPNTSFTKVLHDHYCCINASRATYHYCHCFCSVGREEKFKLVEGKCPGKSLVWLVTPWSVAIIPKRKRLQWKHTAAIPGSSTMVIGGRALLFVETIQRWIAATADHNGPHTAVFFQILEICNKHNQHMGNQVRRRQF